MRMVLDPLNLEHYRLFLRAKELPVYDLEGRTLVVHDEYLSRLGIEPPKQFGISEVELSDFLFDYQRAIVKLALLKGRYCVFADCGLGKTLIFLEYAKHVLDRLPKDRCILIVSPLMVVKQTIAECERWYGTDLPIEQVRAKDLATWLTSGESRIGITNYDALDESIPRGRTGAMILDESSMLKSHYGKWAGECLRLGAGLQFKMACTGTPAPNDRIEYANHATFMDAFPTVNAFLARFFVNRGQTEERWELKPHAIKPFYVALSHWSIFLSNPAVYGWKDGCDAIPPMHVHLHHVDMTPEQQQLVFSKLGTMFVDKIGGITERTRVAQIAKGFYDGRRISTNKPGFIKMLVDSWPSESTIIWCAYNEEQTILEEWFPDAASIRGDTAYERREALIDDFKAGRRKVLISKPKILGFGLNLQKATRQIFSTLHDSYEQYYQAVKRSNRYGAEKELNVHIPFTDVEHPMIANVLRKAKLVDKDTREQEEMFRAAI